MKELITIVVISLSSIGLSHVVSHISRDVAFEIQKRQIRDDTDAARRALDSVTTADLAEAYIRGYRVRAQDSAE